MELLDKNVVAQPTPLKASIPLGKTSFQFQLNREPSGQGFGYPPDETIPIQCEIVFIPESKDKNGKGDTENAYNRLIAYMPGAKSIFVDEWEEHEKKRLAERKNIEPIRFKLGFLTVSANERNKLHYLQLCDFNRDIPNRLGGNIIYREVDRELLSQKAMDVDKMLVKAKFFVQEFPIEEVRVFAIATAKTKGEADAYRTMEEYSLRYAMKVKAEKTPKLFAERMLDGKSKAKAVIFKALDKGIIKVDANETEIGWSSNDESIIDAPAGMNVIEHFADLASKNETYGGIIDKLSELTSTDKPQEEEKKVDWITALLEQAKEKGVIEEVGNFVLVKVEDEEEPRKFGAKKIRDAILTNEDNIIDIITSQFKD